MGCVLLLVGVAWRCLTFVAGMHVLIVLVCCCALLMFVVCCCCVRKLVLCALVRCLLLGVGVCIWCVMLPGGEFVFVVVVCCWLMFIVCCLMCVVCY